MAENRRFCENCGTQIGETTNFCPNCGAGQRPNPDVPFDPPPGEPRRISTAEVPGVPPPPPQEQQGNALRNFIIVVVILIVFVAMIRGCTGGNGDTAGSTTGDGEKAKAVEKQKEEKKEAQKEPASKREDPNPNFSDGTQRVGSDIQAGTYRTREGSPGCYYARLNGFGGGLGDILANDNADGPAVVTIEATDSGFESRRCGTWTQDLSQITDSATSFEDGTYIVGTDVEPGTYRSSGSSGCYYARLSGFHGGGEDIIANGNTDAPTVVQIGATDAGFQSKRCGSWEKTD